MEGHGGARDCRGILRAAWRGVALSAYSVATEGRGWNVRCACCSITLRCRTASVRQSARSAAVTAAGSAAIAASSCEGEQWSRQDGREVRGRWGCGVYDSGGGW